MCQQAATLSETRTHGLSERGVVADVFEDI
jgi:hypothetical protein